MKQQKLKELSNALENLIFSGNEFAKIAKSVLCNFIYYIYCLKFKNSLKAEFYTVNDEHLRN